MTTSRTFIYKLLMECSGYSQTKSRPTGTQEEVYIWIKRRGRRGKTDGNELT